VVSFAPLVSDDFGADSPGLAVDVDGLLASAGFAASVCFGASGDFAASGFFCSAAATVFSFTVALSAVVSETVFAAAALAGVALDAATFGLALEVLGFAGTGFDTLGARDAVSLPPEPAFADVEEFPVTGLFALATLQPFRF
jgi:hypothetical protein